PQSLHRTLTACPQPASRSTPARARQPPATPESTRGHHEPSTHLQMLRPSSFAHVLHGAVLPSRLLNRCLRQWRTADGLVRTARVHGRIHAFRSQCAVTEIAGPIENLLKHGLVPRIIEREVFEYARRNPRQADEYRARESGRAVREFRQDGAEEVYDYPVRHSLRHFGR